jgi:hypothetical protein
MEAKSMPEVSNINAKTGKDKYHEHHQQLSFS